MAESRNSADIMTTSTEDDDANKSSAQTPTTQLPSSHETSRKRKRLSAVLDKLATQIERRSLDSSSSEDASPPSSAAPAPHGGPPEPADKPRSKMRAPPQKQVSLDSEMSRCVETKLDLLDPPIAPRRSPTPPPPLPEPHERRRRTGGSGDCSAVPFSPNRPSFTPPASSEGGSTPPNAAADDVFSPPRGDRSARPPAPALEPLRIPPEGYPDHRLLRPPTTPLPMGNGATALTFPGFPACDCPHCRTLAGRAPFWESGSPLLQKVMSGGGPLTPVSPLTPSFDAFLQAKFLPEFYKRRSHSDSDLQQCLAEAALGRHQHHRAPSDEKRHPTARRPEPLRLPQKGGSLESDQDSPLDLSVKSNGSSNPDTNHGGSSPTRFPLSPLELPDSPVRTATSSPSSLASATRIDATTTTTSGGTTVIGGASARKNVVEVSNSDVAYACPVCGQMFSLHDRLAKHMASRHRGRHRPSPDTTTSSTTGASKSYTCEVCGRSFARSDMLTRHVRLHTGVKPYTCRACGQVFSRSDHLSTHQRTHTGEKPYRCPQCPYAACRRDMITRHMRTHARCELPDSSSGMLVDDRGSPLQHLKLGSPGRVEMAKD